MRDIAAYLNDDVRFDTVESEHEMEQAEGVVLAASGPVLATPAVVTATAFAGGFALGRAIG